MGNLKKKTRPRQWARREVGASEGGLTHEGTGREQRWSHTQGNWEREKVVSHMRELGASEGGLAHEGTWEKQADFHFMCILLGEASLSMLGCFEKLERKEKPQTHCSLQGRDR